MPEVIDRLEALGHDVSRPALQVVGRVHRAGCAAHGFRHRALRHAAGPGLPGFRRQVRHRRLAAARPGEIHGHRRPSARPCSTSSTRMIRRRLEIFTSLPFASLDRMALKAAPRRDRRQPCAWRRLAESDHAGRHQRHGPHRAAGAARRDGRRASRRRTIRARDNRLDVVHVNEIKGGAAATAHLLEFDSIHGRWHELVRRRGRARASASATSRIGFSAARLAGRCRLGRSRLRHRAGMHRQVPQARAARRPISTAASSA